MNEPIGSWDARVTKKMSDLQGVREADEETMKFLRAHLNNARFGDDETFKADQGKIFKGYKTIAVFEATAADGKILVTPIGKPTESFIDRPSALDRMATLMARVILDNPG